MPDQLRQQVGFVLQDGGLFPHLTAGHNITLMAEYQDMARPNTSRSFLHFFTDTSSPTLMITSPRENGVICKDRNLLVKISASDPGCGIRKVSLFFDRVTKGGFVGSDTSSPYEIIVPKARFTTKVHK